MLLLLSGIWTARLVAVTVFPDERASRFLAGGVAFFAQVVLAGALLGFTGNIGLTQYIVFYCAVAVAASLIFKNALSSGFKWDGFLSFMKPAPVGFFLS